MIELDIIPPDFNKEKIYITNGIFNNIIFVKSFNRRNIAYTNNKPVIGNGIGWKVERNINKKYSFQFSMDLSDFFFYYPILKNAFLFNFRNTSWFNFGGLKQELKIIEIFQNEIYLEMIYADTY